MARLTQDGCSVGAASQPAELLRRIDSLTDALIHRQQIGWVTGLLSGCLGLDAQQSWELLAKLSQRANVKVRRLACVIEAARNGDIHSAEDQQVANQLQAMLGTSWKQLMTLHPSAGSASGQDGMPAPATDAD